MLSINSWDNDDIDDTYKIDYSSTNLIAKPNIYVSDVEIEEITQQKIKDKMRKIIST